MEKKEKTKQKTSTVVSAIRWLIVFYLITLIVIFHYSKTGGLLYTFGFPVLVAFPVVLLIWRLTKSSKTIVKDGGSDSASSTTVTKSADSKSKDTTTTKTTVVEKDSKKSKGMGCLGYFASFFALMFFLFTFTILIFYFTGNHRIKDLVHGKGVGGFARSVWEMVWKKNPTDAEIEYKTKKLDAQTLKDTMLLRGQIEIAKKVKRTSIFGTVYEDDQQVQNQTNTNNSDGTNNKPSTTTGAGTNQVQQPQTVKYDPNATPIVSKNYN